MSEAAERSLPLLRRLTGEQWWHSLKATSTRRALLLTALGGLLIAGVITALSSKDDDPSSLAAHLGSNPVPGTDTFNTARTGDCLNWQNKSPDGAAVVSCADDHRFEVAESVDLRTFPGSEFGAGATPPSSARFQQISQEQCEPSVRRYLGTHYDPTSKFTIGMLRPSDKAWSQSGQRHLLCGLQLVGADNTQVAVKGRVAELDQSDVWPAGTCLGIDPTTNKPVDMPVDCGGPHAIEVTGTVNLAERFPGQLPPESDQDAFVKDACTRITDGYLAPVPLRTTTLTLGWGTLSLPSWTAGSHQVSCKVGSTLGTGGWATLVGSAKGPMLINGQPPDRPPDIPDERMNMPPIPMDIPAPSQSQQGQQTQIDMSNPANGTQHLPNAPGPQTPQPQSTNTFMGSAPPPPPLPQAPMDAPDPGQAGPPGPPGLPPPAAPGGPPDAPLPPGGAPPPPAPGGAPPPPAPGGPPPPPAPGGSPDAPAAPGG